MRRILEETMKVAEEERTKNRRRGRDSLEEVNSSSQNPNKDVVDKTFGLFCTSTAGTGDAVVDDDSEEVEDEEDRDNFNLTGLHDFRLQAIMQELDYFQERIQNGDGDSIREMSFSVRFHQEEEDHRKTSSDDDDNDDKDNDNKKKEEENAKHLVTSRQQYAKLGQILATLPQLEELVLLLGHNVGSYDLLIPLLQEVASSVSLSTLHIFAGSSSHMTDQQTEDLSTTLRTMRSLEDFYFGGIRSNTIATALVALPRLTTLELETKDDTSPLDELPTFRPILDALMANTTTPTATATNSSTSPPCSLEDVTLCGFHWDDEFSSTLKTALEHPSPTTNLVRQLTLTPRNLTEDQWRLAMPFLRTNTSLESLSILAALPGTMVVETIQQVASNESSSLVELIFHCPSTALTSEEFIQVVTLLANNNRLAVLTTSNSAESVSLGGTLNLIFDDESYQRLVKAAKLNVGLTSYAGVKRRRAGAAGGVATATPSKDDGDDDDTHVLRIIGNLNQAGRSYLHDDPTSKYRAVEVLADSHIRNDLDAIFFHLLENPGLCCRDEVNDDNGDDGDEDVGVNTTTIPAAVTETLHMEGNGTDAVKSITPATCSPPLPEEQEQGPPSKVPRVG